MHYPASVQTAGAEGSEIETQTLGVATKAATGVKPALSQAALLRQRRRPESSQHNIKQPLKQQVEGNLPQSNLLIYALDKLEYLKIIILEG